MSISLSMNRHPILFFKSAIVVFLLFIQVSAMGAAGVSLSSASVAPGAPFLVSISYEGPLGIPLTVLLVRASVPEGKVSLDSLHPAAALVDAGKKLDCEIVEDQLAFCVFGGNDKIPNGTLGTLLLWMDEDALPDDSFSLEVLEVQGSNKDEQLSVLTGNSGTITVLDAHAPHSADSNGDWNIDLEELLRVVQLYNLKSYHCDGTAVDGFAPGTGSTDCTPHDGDHSPEDWSISFVELLRIIQFYNSSYGHYHLQTHTEDGFAPGPFGIVYDKP